jgi:hypothetical protein
MPSIEELPEGPRRAFVTELRRYYRAAGRPSLRKISQAIERDPDPRLHEVTASAETIRRMITGKVLAVDRDRVQAVFLALCEMAEIGPDDPNYSDYGGYGEPESNWHCVRRLWDIALEEEADAPPLPEPVPEPAPTASTRVSPDPWSSDQPYSDEPPF